MTRALLLLSTAVMLLGCGSRDEDIRKLVRDELGRTLDRKIVAPVPTIGPYSPAVRVGNFLFVSGQIGLDQATGQLRNGSIDEETRQALENVGRILRAEGFDSTNVVNATVYLKNMNDYARMNLIYGGYFQEGAYPARTTVGVTELPKGANVEITVIACK
jgi:2-iminobutanoate/2-iminopropanoate deaminase